MVLKVAIALGIGYLIYLGGRFIFEKSPFFPVSTVEITGNQYIERETILALAAIDYSASLKDVDTEAITNRLLGNAYIKGVSVTTLLPATVRIDIEERQPAFFLVEKGLYMVDETGLMLEKHPNMPIFEVPMITGLSRAAMAKDSTALPGALSLVGKVKYMDREFSKSFSPMISEINFSGKGEPELVLVKGGARAALGKKDQYQRLFLLGNFMLKQQESQLYEIKRIDLTIPDRLIVQKRS